MTTTTPRQLTYEGTVHDLRIQAGRDAYRGEQATQAIWDKHLDTDGPMPSEDAERLLVAVAASSYGWGLVAVLGWLTKEHPELAYRAGCIVQDVQMNGGNRWCEDIPYPPPAA